MLRTLCLITTIAFIPFTSVNSLGLGNIHHKSYLNQKFNADIELLSFDQNKIETLKIGLASAEAFAKAGVDRAFHLFGLRFNIITKNKDSAIIRVSSQEPIREPFLDFLIEAKWPSGSVIREYTVLLDPPPGSDQMNNPMSTVQTLRPIDHSLEYGPITPKDTLWSIAKKIRHPDLSIAEVMKALVVQNPGAFVDNNPDHLLIGKILHLNSHQSKFSKRSKAISLQQKTIEQTQPDKKISSLLKPKSGQPQQNNQLSEKFIRDEISQLQKTLETLYQSEQQQFKQYRQAQNQELLTLIETLSFKINDIQLLLMAQNTQIESGNRHISSQLDELFASAVHSTTATSLENPKEISSPPILLKSALTPDKITGNPEVNSTATITPIDKSTLKPENNYLSLQIILGTLISLLLLFKVFLIRRHHINKKIDNNASPELSPIHPEAPTEVSQPLSPLIIEPITEDSSQENEDVALDRNINAHELQSDLNLEQELNRLLEESIGTIEPEDNENTDYISKMVTTIHPDPPHSAKDKQDNPNSLKSHPVQ